MAGLNPRALREKWPLVGRSDAMYGGHNVRHAPETQLDTHSRSLGCTSKHALSLYESRHWIELILILSYYVIERRGAV